MSYLFQVPFDVRALAGGGASGALLYTYAAGGTTPKATYSEYTLTTPHTNPVVADASGRLPAVFLADTDAYNLVLKTAGGTTLWSQDNVVGTQRSGSSDTTRRQQMAQIPLDYGAAGDGVTDDQAAVQLALNAASSGVTRVVDGVGKTYKCDTAIAVPSGVTLKDITFDFSSCTDEEWIQIHGTLGSYTVLTGNVTFEDATFDVTSAAGFAQGALFHLTDANTYYAAPAGEIGEVLSVASLAITPTSPAQNDYATASAAKAAIITAHTDVVLENVTVLGTQAAAGTNVIAISARNCRRLKLRRVRVDGYEDIAILLAGCHSSRIEDCEVTNGASGSYGLAILHACADITVKGFRAASGTETGITVDASALTPYTATYLGVGEGQPRRVHFEDISLDGCQADCNITPDSAFVTIDNWRSRGGLVAYIQTPTLDIRNLWMEKGDLDLYTAMPKKTGRGYSVSVSDVRLLNGSLNLQPVQLTTGTVLDLVDLSRVRAYAGAINVTLNHANDPDITRLVVDNCYSATLVVAADVGALISSLHVEGGSFGASLFTDVTRISVNGTEFSSATYGLWIAQTNVAFDACRINGVRVSGADDALLINCTTGTCYGLTISGGRLNSSGDAGEYPLHITGVLSDFSITGNSIFRANDTDSCIHLHGTAAGNIEIGEVRGNVINNGTYGVERVNVASTVRTGDNAFTGQVTASQTGGSTDADKAGIAGTGRETNSAGVVGTGTGSGSGAVFAAGATGVGVAVTATAGNALTATGGGSGDGLVATGGSTNGNGVQATGGATNGVGVLASGTGTGNAVHAINSGGTGATLKLTGNSTLAPIRIATLLAAVPSGASLIGDMYVDTAGVLWICTVAGTGGGATWTKVGTQT